MNFVVKQCKKCKEIMGACRPESLVHTANNCNGELETLNISWDELSIIADISTDRNFLQAMIDLKEKDIIEYNLKMSQFKTQLEQQKSAREKVKTDNRLKCPTCGSAKVIRIPGLSKATWVALQGVYSIGKISKTFQCMNCGYKW
jgi:hypothetical protein